MGGRYVGEVCVMCGKEVGGGVGRDGAGGKWRAGGDKKWLSTKFRHGIDLLK